MSVRPRVFISSVMDGFADVRASAKRGVEAANCEPVMAEDFGAVPSSSRNACLDGVASCSVVIVISGTRAGWKTPAGKFVVEEEFEEARRQTKQVLLFVEDAAVDAETKGLRSTIADYTTGRFYKKYKTPDELESAIKEALLKMTLDSSERGAPAAPQAWSEQSRSSGSNALVALQVVPRRKDNLRRPSEMTDELAEKLVGLGTASTSRLFKVLKDGDIEVTSKTIRISQRVRDRRGGTLESVVNFAADGALEVATNLNDRQPRDGVGAGEISVSTVVLREALAMLFAYVAVVYEALDSQHRFADFYARYAILGLGYRTLTHGTPRTSGAMRMASNENVIAFDEPRIVSRQRLAQPAEEIDDVVAELVSRANQQ